MIPFRNRAAALVIVDGSILLVRHVNKNNESYFLLPGGGIEENETTEEAICREMGEETGLNAIPKQCVFITESESPDSKRRIRQFVHLCEVSGEIGNSIDPVVAEALFVPLSEFATLTFYPNIKREILECFKGSFPISPITITVEWE